MLEQYYTGIMDFPPINGVDEGTFCYVWFCWAPAIWGGTQYWWLTKDNWMWLGNYYPRAHTLMWNLQIMMVVMAIVGCINIWKKRNTEYC
jgi:hypothetical protein